MPKFIHDCTACKFMGTLSHIDRVCDLYYHPGTNNMLDSTIIARYGNEEPNYTSGITFAAYNPVIAIAAIRALFLGHMTLDELQAHCHLDINNL